MYQQLVVQVAQTKLQLITALDGLFPEFMTVSRAVVVAAQSEMLVTLGCAGVEPAYPAPTAFHEP
jgi:hypothetical protein